TIFAKKSAIQLFAAGNFLDPPKSPIDFNIHSWTQIKEVNLYENRKFLFLINTREYPCEIFMFRLVGINKPWVIGSMILFWILVSITCFVLRNRQPLKSRG